MTLIHADNKISLKEVSHNVIAQKESGIHTRTQQTSELQ